MSEGRLVIWSKGEGLGWESHLRQLEGLRNVTSRRAHKVANTLSPDTHYAWFEDAAGEVVWDYGSPGIGDLVRERELHRR